MAITQSYGYPGDVDSVAWAKMTHMVGDRYGVADYPDFRVTAVGGPDRTVAVAGGWAFGRGVLDFNDAPINIQLDAGTGAVGSVRYDLIAVRRIWGTSVTSSSTIVKVNGSSSPVVPAGRHKGPGVDDDQPLALVKITTGSTVPVIEADLRSFPSKVNYVSDLRAVVDEVFGDQAQVGGQRWVRRMDATNTPSWMTDAAPAQTYQPAFTCESLTPGALGSTSLLRGMYVVENGWCELHLYFGFGNANGGTGPFIFGYPPGIKPDTAYMPEWWGDAKIWVPLAGGQFPGHAWFRPNGIYPYSVSSASDPREQAAQNADAVNPGQQAALGTGWPRSLTNSFPWNDQANLTVTGRFKIA